MYKPCHLWDDLWRNLQPSRQRRVKLKPLKNLRPSGPSTLKPAGLVHKAPATKGRMHFPRPSPPATSLPTLRESSIIKLPDGWSWVFSVEPLAPEGGREYPDGPSLISFLIYKMLLALFIPEMRFFNALFLLPMTSAAILEVIIFPFSFLSTLTITC